MNKRTYEEYIKNGCHPVGYNEPCQSYYFGQTSVDLLLDKIDQLKQQLAETEQEFLVFQEDSARNEQIYIRELAEKQNTIDKINKEFVQAVHDWKALCAEKDKEIATLKAEIIQECKEHQDIMQQFEQVEKQFAIQELEKVKVNLKDRITMMSNEEHSYLQKVVIWYDICNQVNKQIKELKGEKDVED